MNLKVCYKIFLLLCLTYFTQYDNLGTCMLLQMTFFLMTVIFQYELPWWYSGKESACQCVFDPWVNSFSPWERKWQPTPVFLLGKSHGQKGLAGFSPWGHKRVGHNLVIKKQQKYSNTYMYQFFLNSLCCQWTFRMLPCFGYYK